MPRTPRIDLPGLPQHVIVRGNDRMRIFRTDQDRQRFVRYLVEACAKNQSSVHAFVLMSNHVHLLVSGLRARSLSGTMQSVGRRYSRYFNDTNERTGTLFEGRFKSSVIETERYFLTCMRYVELNPVRARMVSHPADYAWSSYKENASGRPSGILTPHPEYMRLGGDAQERALAYRALIERGITEDELIEIREHANRSLPLGSSMFVDGVEVTLGRPARRKPVGRPPPPDSRPKEHAI